MSKLGLFSILTAVFVLHFTSSLAKAESPITDADLKRIIEKDLSEPGLAQLKAEAGPTSSMAQWLVLGETIKSLNNPNVMAALTDQFHDPQVNLVAQGYDFSFGPSSPVEEEGQGSGTQVPFTGTIKYFFYYSHICGFPKITLTGRVTTFGVDRRYYELHSFALEDGGAWAGCL